MFRAKINSLASHPLGWAKQAAGVEVPRDTIPRSPSGYDSSKAIGVRSLEIPRVGGVHV